MTKTVMHFKRKQAHTPMVKIFFMTVLSNDQHRLHSTSYVLIYYQIIMPKQLQLSH